MANNDQRPIIIKKRKIIAAGHHGGAWKVAYADFVTAMMAFFMVMWLVATVSKEERAAIFDYFKNPSMEPGKASRPAPGQMGPGGASTSPIDMGGGLDSPKSILSTSPGAGAPVASEAIKQDVIKEAVMKEAAAAEHKKLESLMEELRRAMSESQALKPFKDQLLLDITPEGLRIQIVDEQNRPMFDIGSSRLKDYTVGILKELAQYLNTVSNRISLSGHTDIRPYPSNNYSNWELSADRANAARRALENGGMASAKVARVVGLSSSVLFDKEHPEDPINRRISIIVMTKAAEDQALKTDDPHLKEAENADPNTLPPARDTAPLTADTVPVGTVDSTPLGNPIGVSTPTTRFTPVPQPAEPAPIKR
jgi:chemotaxis protein MotB